MHIAWAGAGNTMWPGNLSKAGGSSSARDCCTHSPGFSGMSVSLCLAPWLGSVPAAAFPTHLAEKKSQFKHAHIGVVWGELPRVRSTGGCLNISRGGLKTTSGLWDVFALSCRMERWGPAYSHLSGGYLQPELPWKVNPPLGMSCCQSMGSCSERPVQVTWMPPDF